MNLKPLSAFIAVVSVFTMLQTADAKDKDWKYRGQNRAVTTGGSCDNNGVGYGQQGGWRNGNNYFNQQLGQFNGGNSWQNGRYYNQYNRGNSPWANRNGNFQNSNGRPWQFNSANIDQTQARLASRIQSGMASGKLTPQEAQRLNQMQSRIDQMETRFRSDNRLGSGERARLSSELGRLQDRLRKELSDRQTF